MYAFFASNAHMLPLGGILYHIMKENVFRTVLVLAVNCVLIYVNSMSSTMDENINYIASLCGAIIIYFLMNLELYWKETRDKEPSGPSSKSAKKSALSSNMSAAGIQVKKNVLTEVETKQTA
ncbi:hypothetical protein BCR33DRAFT_305092 [Rhizoclosmatium globosum]|uniref:Uncharacterized protein n=1 Tax=Rhizoclosmatium globosum TaxID=329046 RepID=A0A1Y2C785_9FUNG|nr:hypothetical protein BCR33DRAFT_305092 [Rhizoclosmatium globosum]|eukprot:ORY42165.1 hypothetical protein BCR33DRAFT_305092 [Rhizoclosmatium globosum]